MLTSHHAAVIADRWSKAWSAMPSFPGDEPSPDAVADIADLFSDPSSVYVDVLGNEHRHIRENVHHFKDGWWAVANGGRVQEPWLVEDDTWAWMSHASLYLGLLTFPDPPEQQIFVPCLGIAEMRLLDVNTIGSLSWRWGPVRMDQLATAVGPPKVVHIVDGEQVDPWSLVHRPEKPMPTPV